MPALLALTALHASAAPAYTQDDVDRVTRYIAERYGEGTPLATAAGVYIRAAATLWEEAARTQQYDQSATVQAAIRELCFRTQLELAGVANPAEDVAALERTAQNPALYSGYIYATVLAGQHPLDNVQITPRQACEKAGVPLPVTAQ
ncbi:hypothetical protein [Paraburkholderia sp. J8-2]|uniref:hypothetical protein n=1 Tax=Paraburkholderia sp. J8-2 TaxID=2805440 RepID=UPI002AB5F23F|nr:hypothetical protein [Paraburkholderia sp. J8-2]